MQSIPQLNDKKKKKSELYFTDYSAKLSQLDKMFSSFLGLHLATLMNHNK